MLTSVAWINDYLDRPADAHEQADLLTAAGFPLEGSVALAGDIPPELKDDPGIKWPSILIGRGNTDEWYTQEKMYTDLEFFHSINVKPETCCFNAGLAWTEDFRKSIGQFLCRIR